MKYEIKNSEYFDEFKGIVEKKFNELFDKKEWSLYIKYKYGYMEGCQQTNFIELMYWNEKKYSIFYECSLDTLNLISSIMKKEELNFIDRENKFNKIELNKSNIFNMKIFIGFYEKLLPNIENFEKEIEFIKNIPFIYSENKEKLNKFGLYIAEIYKKYINEYSSRSYEYWK
jgi:hypothetical protein